MAAKSKFIVIDGGEGSGKTTLLKLLPEIFPDEKIVTTREPGGSPFAEEIRAFMLTHPLAGQASPETQFGLVWGARHDHMKNFVMPKLQEGFHVFCDRFDSSTYAYQIFGQEAPHLEKLFWQIRETYLKTRVPDLYIFLDVDPRLGLERVALRRKTQNHFDERDPAFHERIRKGFLKFMKKVPSVVIDTSGDIPEAREKFAEALRKALC